jgi:cycloeucalenol cycloisomerase
VGNYWYTHYFYRVLRADYTFPAHRLNDVPLCLYFMTHAYFMARLFFPQRSQLTCTPQFYHGLSNAALRRVRTGYRDDAARRLFEAALILALAYTTAFGESLTICGFPYYTFEDRDVAYTLGSAFYGIYFLVSFPAFLRVDEEARRPFGLGQACVEALAASMGVLILLDAVRLWLGVPLFSDRGKGR